MVVEATLGHPKIGSKLVDTQIGLTFLRQDIHRRGEPCLPVEAWTRFNPLLQQPKPLINAPLCPSR